MTNFTQQTDPVFSRLDEVIAADTLPEKFTFPFDYEPHPLSLLAVGKLQSHLENQQDWDHDFGLKDQQEGAIGKMFVVLVVQTEQNEVGYLSAFSGKLDGRNHHVKFVPPIFDGGIEGGFLNQGIKELTQTVEDGS